MSRHYMFSAALSLVFPILAYAQINGTGGNDNLTGTGGDDTINGLGGNDTINGLGGDDTCNGGPGNDAIDGGVGIDTLNGDGGNDTINGGEGDDAIDGGIGDDSLNGETGDDTISGGEGSDKINGGEGADNIDGGNGNDRINGGEGDDTINGNDGNDRIRGGTGKDTYNTHTNDGNDRLIIVAGDVPPAMVETVACGSGDDTVSLLGFTAGDITAVGGGGWTVNDPDTGGAYAIGASCEHLKSKGDILALTIHSTDTGGLVHCAWNDTVSGQLVQSGADTNADGAVAVGIPHAERVDVVTAYARLGGGEHYHRLDFGLGGLRLQDLGLFDVPNFVSVPATNHILAMIDVAGFYGQPYPLVDAHVMNVVNGQAAGVPFIQFKDAASLLPGSASVQQLLSAGFANSLPNFNGQVMVLPPDSYDAAIGDFDCTGNGIVDYEDIANGEPDTDDNGIPDACTAEFGVPRPVADPSGFNKCRFISFSVPDSGEETALRVRLITLHNVNPPYTGGATVAFTAFEGQSLWVGAPAQYVESAASGVPFYAAHLQCSPHYRNWSTVPLLHVTAVEVVPSSVYEVENLAASCMGNEAGCAAVSSPLQINTTRWGDVQVPFNPPSPTTQPDNTDQSAVVAKFQNQAGAIIKARALLAGNGPSGFIDSTMLSLDVGFAQIGAVTSAFQGNPYPYKPGVCGGAGGVCITNAECTGGNTPPCLLACGGPTGCTGPGDCPDDGLFCNGPESCDLGSGNCISPDPCAGPTPVCDEVTDTCSGTACCDGDVNNDSNVNGSDISIVVDCLRGRISNPNCDVNCDSAVTSRDLEDVLASFQGLVNPCSQVHGACIRPDHPQCLEAIGVSRCENTWSGTYLGDNTTCDPSPADCNGNGMADGCDIDCSAMAGACDVPGCGSSADCNLNAMPDECDDAAGGDTDADGIIEVCEGVVGACCTEAFCTMTTESECVDDPDAVFQGVGVACAGQAQLLLYEADPNQPIPDAGNPNLGTEDTISVTESYHIADIDVDLVIDHTWIGDLEVTLTHNGESVVLVDRPGIPPPGFGCPSNDYNIVLDDSGTGGAVESLCAGDANPTPVSPPNYTPNGSLSAFNGNNAYGDWTIRVRDLSSQDTGTLVHWSLHITSVPASNICAPAPPLDDPTGIAKSRSITIAIDDIGNVASGPAAPMIRAIRIRMISLHHVDPPYLEEPELLPFTDYESGVNCSEGPCGCVRYAGEPEVYNESTGNSNKFVASKLGCTPVYRNWSNFYGCSYTPMFCDPGGSDCPSSPRRCDGGRSFTTCTVDTDCTGQNPPPCAAESCVPIIPEVLHILGDEVAPSSVYDVQYLEPACAGIECCCARVSAPCDPSVPGSCIETTRWCDLEVPHNPPDTSDQPDFGDISAMINKFQGKHHPIKVRAIMDGSNPSLINDVDFGDISLAINSYKGYGYPYPGPIARTPACAPACPPGCPLLCP